MWCSPCLITFIHSAQKRAIIILLILQRWNQFERAVWGQLESQRSKLKSRSFALSSKFNSLVLFFRIISILIFRQEKECCYNSFYTSKHEHSNFQTINWVLLSCVITQLENQIIFLHCWQYLLFCVWFGVGPWIAISNFLTENYGESYWSFLKRSHLCPNCQSQAVTSIQPQV